MVWVQGTVFHEVHNSGLNMNGGSVKVKTKNTILLNVTMQNKNTITKSYYVNSENTITKTYHGIF